MKNVMTVKELIERLQKQDPNAKVLVGVLENNGYNYVCRLRKTSILTSNWKEMEAVAIDVWDNDYDKPEDDNPKLFE